MNKTKNQNLIKESISLNIDDHSFEFIVTCTIYGEMLSVQNLFFELPEDAQKLVLGKNYESIKKKVHAHERLLSYRIPLGYVSKMSYSEHVDKDLDGLFDKIFEEKKRAGVHEKQILFNFLHQDWNRKLYKILTSEKHRTDDNIRGFKGLTMMFRNDDKGIKRTLEEIKYSNFKLGEPILKIIFPILENQDEKIETFKAFSSFLSNSNYSFLIKQFEKEDSVPIRSAIIEGIHKYNTPKNLNFILDQYEKKTVNIDSVLKALGTFKNKKAEEILWEHFEKFENSNHSTVARESLRTIGISEKKIVQKLTPALFNSKEFIASKNILEHFHYIKNYFLYPSPGEIFRKTKTMAQQTKNNSLSYAITVLTAPHHNYKISQKIKAWLNSENENLQKLSIEILNRYLTDYDFLVDWKFYNDITDRLLYLYQQEVEFKKKIINCFGYLLRNSKNLSYLDILITLEKEAKNDEIKSSVTYAIKGAIEEIPNNKKMINFLLENKNSNNKDLRKVIIRTLVKINLPEIKEVINQLKSDPDPDIRNIVTGNDEWNDTFNKWLSDMKIKKEKEFNLFNKTKYYLESKLPA